VSFSKNDFSTVLVPKYGNVCALDPFYAAPSNHSKVQKKATFGINTHTEKGQVRSGSPPKLKFLEFDLKTAFASFLLDSQTNPLHHRHPPLALPPKSALEVLKFTH
jgi:hypothetical protein